MAESPQGPTASRTSLRHRGRTAIDYRQLNNHGTTAVPARSSPPPKDGAPVAAAGSTDGADTRLDAPVIVETPEGFRYPITVNLRDSYTKVMYGIEEAIMALQPPTWIRVEELYQPVAKAYELYFNRKPVPKGGSLFDAGVAANAILVLLPVPPVLFAP